MGSYIPIPVKPYTKIQSFTSATPAANFEFVDSLGAYIPCNYISVAMGSLLTTTAYTEVALSSITGKNIAFGNGASGSLGGIATTYEKFEIILPSYQTCSSINISVKGIQGAGSVNVFVTYGVYKEPNILKSNNRFGGK